MITIKDLKALIADLPDDMPVGVVGHFGELWDMDSSDFYVRSATVVPEGKSLWPAPDNQMKVLQIDTPDIGDGPE